MPKFSIITCTKNSGLSVDETIKSLNRQNFRDFEHIFVDGGSIDNTQEICSKSINSKFFIEPQLSLYQALNFGIKKSTGEIIFFLHSDDQIVDDKLLNNILDIFNQNNVQFIYSNIIMKKNFKLIRTWKSKKFLKKDIKNFQFPAHTSLFYKKDVFMKIGNFNTNYKISSDFEHLIRLFNSNLENYFYDKITISMNYGGISTKSIKNILFQNYENYLILRKNNVNIIKVMKIFILKFFERLNQLKK